MKIYCFKEKYLMRRKTFILAAILLTLVFALCGCAENSYGPIDTLSENGSAKVMSNGGTVVIQGSYLYFINGITSYSSENTFGNVVKGAIYRVQLDGEGNVVEDTLQCVVPKKVFNSYKNGGGFYVFGDWIYYSTPSTIKDTSGNETTTILEFYRAKTDGTSTQLILRLDGNSTPYAFSDKNLVYYSSNTLYSVDLTDANFKSVVLSENVTAATFSAQTEYDPADTSVNNEFVVFYTKAATEEKATYNELYVTTFDGSVNKLLIGKETYFSEEELGEITKPEDSLDYKRLYTVSVLGYQNGVLYFTKSYSESGSSTACGVFSYDFSAWFDADNSYDIANEVQYSTVNYTSVFSIGEGKLLASDGSAIWLIKPIEGSAIRKKIFTAANSVRYFKDGYVYYCTSGALDVYRIKFAPLENDTEPEQRQDVTDSTPLESWLPMEFIGDYLYYENPDYSYIYRLNLTDGTEEMLGEMNAADKEAYEESLEEEEEAA